MMIVAITHTTSRHTTTTTTGVMIHVVASTVMVVTVGVTIVEVITALSVDILVATVCDSTVADDGIVAVVSKIDISTACMIVFPMIFVYSPDGEDFIVLQFHISCLMN